MININDVLKERRKLRKKPRRIFNDDGAAAWYYSRDFGYPVTEESWLKYRFGPLNGLGNHKVPYPTKSDFTSIAFNTDYIGWVSRSSNIKDMKIGYGLPTELDIPNTLYGDVTEHLIEQTGKDPLQILGDFLDNKETELFYTIRMNDRHDARYPKEDLVPIKQNMWDTGALLSTVVDGVFILNSGLDYDHTDSVNLVKASIFEVVNNHEKYKIDGVCLDFNRSLGLFKNTVNSNLPETSQEQLDIVTNLLYEINDAMNQVSLIRMQKGKPPLLLMIKGPDEENFAKLCGLDVSRWMKEGLVDIYCPIGHHQLNSLRNSISWGRRNGVQVCPSLQDVRLKDRGSRVANLNSGREGLRGRMIQILELSGNIEVFNYNYSIDPSDLGPSAAIWRNLTPEGLKSLGSRRYYITWTNQDPMTIGNACRLPARTFYQPKVFDLSSDHLHRLTSSYAHFEMEVPENPREIRRATLLIKTSGNVKSLKVLLNNTLIPLTANLSEYTSEINLNVLKKGVNTISLSGTSGYVKDIELIIE